MRIKQWIVNYLFKNVRIQHQDKCQPGFMAGHTILGEGWRIDIPGEPQPVVAPSVWIPYVPKYSTRTPAEHAAIRRQIQRDPATCPHTKGSRLAISKDYNVSCHTFINGETKIRCLSCRRVWTSNDPDWKEAVKMVEGSTNTPTSSEAPMLHVKLRTGEYRVYQTKEAIKKDFPDYDGHVDN